MPETLQLIELLDIEREIFVCSSFSHVRLPLLPHAGTVARQAPLVLGIFWARMPEQIGYFLQQICRADYQIQVDFQLPGGSAPITIELFKAQSYGKII